MTERFATSSGQLWLGDCLALMRGLPDGLLDCLVTDPPYRVISGGNKSPCSPPVGILKENDGKIFKHNDIAPGEWLPEAFRLLKPGSHAYVMTNFLNLQTFMVEMERAGFYLHNLLVWEKNNALPNRWYMKNAEYVIFAKKGKAKSINNPSSKTVHRFINPKDKQHPTQKPVDMMRHYIENSTLPGEVVFDPFAGSGSTAVAAMQSGRRWVSMEVDPAYFYGSCGRIWAAAH